MILQITQTDINNANRADGFNCLLANHINKLLLSPYSSYVSHNQLIIYNSPVTRYTVHGEFLFFYTTKDHTIINLPNVLKSKIIQWDKGKELKPFETFINIPLIYLA